jgi:ribosomal-protein-alanine N-acetyltransferase
MQVCPLTIVELPWVLELERSTFARPWSKGSFLVSLASSQQIFFVAKAGDRLLGYIGLWRMYDSVHVTNIAVEPRSRRQGVATRLLVEAEKWASGLPLTLEARASNRPARALYEKFGFVACGVRPGYYEDNGEDAVIFWKEPEFESTGD